LNIGGEVDVIDCSGTSRAASRRSDGPRSCPAPTWGRFRLATRERRLGCWSRFRSDWAGTEALAFCLMNVQFISGWKSFSWRSG